jgi:hypothetical protein
MQEGRTIEDLARELMRQANTKRDFVADTRHAQMEDGGKVMALQFENHAERFGVKDTAHSQFATKLRIPKPYYDRMREEAPALLDANVNHWLQQQPQQRMFRTLDSDVRALVSPKFRALDNLDLAEAVLPVVADTGMQVRSTQVTDRRLYLQAVTDRIQGEVARGDVVQAGLVISNSEIGEGSLNIEEMIFRLICLNGQIMGSVLRKTHVGRSQAGIDLAEARELMSDSTKRLDDAAFFSKVRDVVRNVVSQESFDRNILKLQGAAEQKIEGDPAKAVEVVQKKLGLNDVERGGLLRNLIEGHDLSGWGLANAVTRLAHDAEDYDRSVELERAGTTIIELPKSDWQEIAAAA